MNEERMADKIQKLLTKAERASTEEEAASFYAKAQELMTKYSIDEARFAQAHAVQAEPVVRTVTLGRFGSGIKARRAMLATVAGLNNCRVWMTPDRATLYVAGFEIDVENALLLFTSLEVQMATALGWALRGEFNAMDHGTKASFRTNWSYGYVGRIGYRLKEAKDATVQRAEAEATSVSTALVLANRGAQVQRWVEDRVGPLRKGAGARHQYNADAHRRGTAAGDRANLDPAGRKGISG